jgi:hypothetical protein
VRPRPACGHLLLGVLLLARGTGAQQEGNDFCNDHTQYEVTVNGTTTCHSCAACGAGQECVRKGPRAGCADCPRGWYNHDGDPITGCSACPADTTSQPGATECAAVPCGSICRSLALSITGGALLWCLQKLFLEKCLKWLRRKGWCSRCLGSMPAFETVEDFRRTLSKKLQDQLFSITEAEFDELLLANVKLSSRKALREEWKKLRAEKEELGELKTPRSPAMLQLQVDADTEKDTLLVAAVDDSAEVPDAWANRKPPRQDSENFPLLPIAPAPHTESPAGYEVKVKVGQGAQKKLSTSQRKKAAKLRRRASEDMAGDEQPGPINDASLEAPSSLNAS